MGLWCLDAGSPVVVLRVPLVRQSAALGLLPLPLLPALPGLLPRCIGKQECTHNPRNQPQGWIEASLATSSLLKAVGFGAGPVGAAAATAGIKWILKVGVPPSPGVLVRCSPRRPRFVSPHLLVWPIPVSKPAAPPLRCCCLLPEGCKSSHHHVRNPIPFCAHGNGIGCRMGLAQQAVFSLEAASPATSTRSPGSGG